MVVCILSNWSEDDVHNDASFVVREHEEGAFWHPQGDTHVVYELVMKFSPFGIITNDIVVIEIKFHRDHYWLGRFNRHLLCHSFPSSKTFRLHHP